MTLPSSGPISMDDINVELGYPAGTLISLNDSEVRSLAGIPTGPISLTDFYGKSAGINLTINPGNSGSTWGYRNFDGVPPSEFGSLIPSNIDGQEVLDLVFQQGTLHFFVWLDGLLPKDFFTSITIEGGLSSNPTTFDTSTATHFQNVVSGETYWRWNSSDSWSDSNAYQISIEK